MIKWFIDDFRDPDEPSARPACTEALADPELPPVAPADAPPAAATPGPAAAPAKREPPPVGRSRWSRFKPRPTRRNRLIARVAKVTAKVLLAYYAFAVLLLVVYRWAPPPVTGVQLERKLGSLFGDGDYDFRRTRVAYASLPPHVARAVVAAEDGRFFSHWGFDLKELRAAGREALEGEGMRGASTITQQLMKNLFGCTCRNPIRKLYDYALTPPAELILPKERILELYLNNVEWGPDGVFGIQEAARYHYGTDARRLSRAQAAGLAALLPNPIRRTPETTAGYRSEILRRMSVRGW